MISSGKWNRVNKLLPFVLLIALSIFLRFYEVGSFSLSNDELSAVIRADQADFNLLIEEGVVKTDPHPAGVQVFLYFWTKTFKSPFTIRFPFVMASLLALFFLFLFFRSRLGTVFALAALSLFALSEITVIHSQLARPYAIGMFSVSWFIWAWNEFLFKKNNSWWVVVSFIISASLSAYVHYYAALFTAILFAVGIVVARKNHSVKRYLLLALSSVLLFLPHLSITLRQLSRGPLTQWIDPPGWSFLPDHMYSLLNQSPALLGVYVFLFLLTSFRIATGKSKHSGIYFLSLFLFLGPMVVGYIYSYFFGSALMDRVLLFSSPFFYLLPFTGVTDKFEKHQYATLLILLTFSITFTSPSFRKREYVENFLELSQDLDQARSLPKTTLILGNFNSPEYVNFYLPENPVDFDMDDLSQDENISRAMAMIRSSPDQHACIAWACKSTRPAIVEYCRIYFPVSRYQPYYNGGIWSFQKGSAHRDTLMFLSPVTDTLLSSGLEFIDLYKNVRKVNHSAHPINVHGFFEGDMPAGIHLVYSVTNAAGESLYWEGHELNVFARHGREFFVTFDRVIEFNGPATFSIYLWNPGGKEASISEIRLSSFSDNHYPDLY